MLHCFLEVSSLIFSREYSTSYGLIAPNSLLIDRGGLLSNIMLS